MLLKSDKSYLFLSNIKEYGAHEAISNWTLMKNSEVHTKQKNKDVKLKNILSIFYFKRNRFPDGGLIKHKDRICAHVIM